MVTKAQIRAYDAVIIGGGHNGLVCAGYLARAGLKVAVVERRHIVGGACVTEEFSPWLSQFLLRLSGRVAGARGDPRSGSCTARAGDSGTPGRHLQPPARWLDISSCWPTRPRSRRSFRPATAPPMRNFGAAGPRGGGDAGDRARTRARHDRRLGRTAAGPPRGLAPAPACRAEDRAEFAALMLKSLGDFLDERFENEAFKGVYGFKGLVGNMASPYATGSAYVLLHHVFGEVNGKRGKWGQPRGGMGAITQAMQKSLEARGGAGLRGQGVREVIVERGPRGRRGAGDGRHAARASWHRASIRGCCFCGCSTRALAGARGFRRRMEAWRCRSGTFRMNVALSELPDFTARPGKEVQRHHQGTVTIAPSLPYLERAYDDARHKGWSETPVISMCIPPPSTPNLPQGAAHRRAVLPAFQPGSARGRGNWHDHRDEVARWSSTRSGSMRPTFPAAVTGLQGAHAARSGRGIRAGGRRHLPRRDASRSAFQPAPGAGGGRLHDPVKGLFQCGRARIRAAG
jgi:phytoene dehydrogenase-like protein